MQKIIFPKSNSPENIKYKIDKTDVSYLTTLEKRIFLSELVSANDSTVEGNRNIRIFQKSFFSPLTIIALGATI